MADGPRVLQARPIRNLSVSDSFQFTSIDAAAEAGLTEEERARIKKERGILDDRSILHPDQERFARRVGGGLPTDQKPLQSPPAVEVEDPFPNGAAPGDLGPALKKFVGVFHGNGFNMILRPQNGPDNRPGTAREVLLEMNFTHEKLSFMDWKVLKDVPNRGFDRQEDVNLRGIPYMQEIEDLVDHTTGKVTKTVGNGKGIHFEQGLFMRTPALTLFEPFKLDTRVKQKTPILGPTITRMASIPHGTTINAQSLDPLGPIPGPPKAGPFAQSELDKTIIFPFQLAILDENKKPMRAVDPINDAIKSFTQLDFNVDTELDRLPLKFKETKASGAIVADQFRNPVNFLTANNKKLKILEHVTFTVDTQPRLDLWGGGTDNIAQLAERQEEVTNRGVTVKDLDGKPAHVTHVAKNVGTSSANANPVKVTCTYWISTVEETITIPAIEKPPTQLKNPNLPKSDDNLRWPVVSPKPTEGVKNKPSYEIRLNKNEAEFDALVKYTQIQYFQNVTLDFGTLSWPHISVATLVPLDALPIKEEGKDFVRQPKKK
jgi:hypothetical protein